MLWGEIRNYKKLYYFNVLGSRISTQDAVANTHVDLVVQESLFREHGIAIAYLNEPQRCKATAGTVLQRCFMKLEQFRNTVGYSVCVYKVGLTSNPIIRLQSYLDRNYSHMTLLHVTSNLGEAQMLEAALICSSLSKTGCRNEKLGGDGPKHTIKEPWHFVYVVGARADKLKAIC